MRDGLAQFGAIVVTAASVGEARGLLVTEMPDVIVSDLAMPGEDGCSFISELRAQCIDTPAIALTAADRFDSRNNSFACSFTSTVRN